MSTTLIQLQSGTKSYGSRVLFDSASFAINDDEHIGVIGPNGAGKTTLFKILSGQEELDKGEVTKSYNLRLAYLEQESDWDIEEKVEEYLTHNCIKPIWELKQFGLKLGLTETHFNSHLKELSGGYRMRVKLLYLIGLEPNLLLLDEPTNFLDLETLLVLEEFLIEFKGAFLLISHDREFLRKVTNNIVEVEAGDIVKYPGNLDDYFEQKALLRTILEKQIMSQEAKRKSVMDFVTRFGAKATKAKQAQSRLKRLEKMEKIEVKKLPVSSVIQIPKPTPTGKAVIEIEKLFCGYQDKVILKNITLRLERGNHIGIVGFNGAGKSTLLKTLSQEIPALSGDFKLGHQVTYSYFAQHSTDKLHVNQSVLENLQTAAHRDCTQQDILNMAGSLLFSGDAVHKKVSVLSGGEKSRVALGQILLKKNPLLFLDEPTNHLDFDTVEALTQALEEYEGTILCVSHDRSFISRVANRILEVKDGELTLYPGTYEDYVWSLQKGVLSERNYDSAPTSQKSSSANPEEKKVNTREIKKKLESEIKILQKNMKSIENKTNELIKKKDELSMELINGPREKAGQISKEFGLIMVEINKLEEELLEKMEQEAELAEKLKSLF